MLSHAPDRWRVVNTTVSATLSWYRLLYDYTIPKSMRARGEGTLNQGHLTYVDSPIKLKCWDGVSLFLLVAVTSVPNPSTVASAIFAALYVYHHVCSTAPSVVLSPSWRTKFTQVGHLYRLMRPFPISLLSLPSWILILLARRVAAVGADAVCSFLGLWSGMRGRPTRPSLLIASMHA